MVTPTRIGVTKFYPASEISLTDVTKLNATYVDVANVIKQACTDAGFVLSVNGTNSAITDIKPQWTSDIVKDTPVYQIYSTSLNGSLDNTNGIAFLPPRLTSDNGNWSFWFTFTKDDRFNDVASALTSVDGAILHVVADGVLGVVWLCATWVNPAVGTSTQATLMHNRMIFTRTNRFLVDSITVPYYGWFSQWQFDIKPAADLKLFSPIRGATNISTLNSRTAFLPPAIAGFGTRISSPINAIGTTSGAIGGTVMGVRDIYPSAASGFTHLEPVTVNGETYVVTSQMADEFLIANETWRAAPWITPSSALLCIAPASGFADLGTYTP